MTDRWTRPSPSYQRHTIVPILTLIVRVPPNPLIARPDSRISPMKSSMSSEMHAVHRLSMPIGFKLVAWTLVHRDLVCLVRLVRSLESESKRVSSV